MKRKQLRQQCRRSSSNSEEEAAVEKEEEEEEEEEAMERARWSAPAECKSTIREADKVGHGRQKKLSCVTVRERKCASPE